MFGRLLPKVREHFKNNFSCIHICCKFGRNKVVGLDAKAKSLQKPLLKKHMLRGHFKEMGRIQCYRVTPFPP